MIYPGPSFVPLVEMPNLDSFLSEFEGVSNIVGGVAVYGSAAAYALVWELGSRRLKSPGPKTLWSLNRNDEPAILTRQAPRGYIGFYEDEFWPIIQRELNSVDFSGTNSRAISLALSVAIDNASQAIAAIISEAAPKDSGALSSQIQMVDSDETDLLGTSNSMSDSTFIL